MGWPGSDCRIALPPITARYGIGHQRRENFTIAHELGHFMIRETLQGIVPRSVFSREWPDEERLCNTFAEELLMPTIPLRQDLSQCGFRVSRIRALSDSYEVSLKALLWRATRLLRYGLGGEVSAMIWAKDGRHFELDWASPYEFRAALLCDSGRTSVERAYDTQNEEEGLDEILVDGRRSRWTCSSVRISGTQILTLATKSLDEFRKYKARKPKVIKSHYPIQMSLPLGA